MWDVEQIPHVVKPLRSSAKHCGIPHGFRKNSTCTCGVPHMLCGVPHVCCGDLRYGMVQHMKEKLREL